MNALQNYRLHEACRQLRLLRVRHTARHHAQPLEPKREVSPVPPDHNGADARKATFIADLWHPEYY